jgi:pimeloyl-ACP methyl ester carboxylesterase
LADRLRCIAVDMRGHGDSGWSDDYRIAASVADIVALIDHLAAGPVHLVGMSLGGCVAGHAAAAMGERAASLTFVDVGAEVDFAASATVRDFMGKIGAVPRIEDLVSEALAVSPRTDADLMLYRYRALMKPSPEGFVLRQDRRRPPDFPHILGELARLADFAKGIVCPVLVVRGGRSRILTDETAARFADRFPNGRWLVVPDAGHNVQEDNPVGLIGALCDHIFDPRRLSCA